MQLAAGVMLTEQLRLSHELGEGAMGKIWAADHLSAQRRVAIKFMSAELAATNAQALKRFEREAVMLEGIRHPNIVELLSCGRAFDGTPFIVLELMTGVPLIDDLEREGLFELDELQQLVDQLAAALSALHERDIIHRDVKAENIFIDRSNGALRFKLFDFGLAKNSASESVASKKLTGVGMMVGTSEYMSPEQMISSKDADFTADLWALAVVAYVTLAGALPFQGGSLAKTFALLRKGEFERPSSMRDDVTAIIDRWFERAFDSDFNKRFVSAAKMAEALRKAIAGAPPSMAPPKSRRAPDVRDALRGTAIPPPPNVANVPYGGAAPLGPPAAPVAPAVPVAPAAPWQAAPAPPTLDQNLELLPAPPPKGTRSALIAMIVVGVLIAAVVLAVLLSK